MTEDIVNGWLKKETGGAIKRFEKRWVVVSGTQLIYAKKEEQPPIGRLELPGMKISSRAEGEACRFDLESPEQTYHFQAESKPDREKWIMAISRICYAPTGGGMFGSSIETTCKREKLHGGGAVPLVLKRCLAFLDSEERLKEAGIFRLPGNERMVRQLKDEFQRGENPELDDADTYTVGSLMKLYLRNLPTSLIPASLYEDFIAMILTYNWSEKEGLLETKHLLTKIPRCHHNTLKVLCRFLYKVKSYADSNKMDLQNLAIVFSPTMIRTAGGNINQEMSDMKSMKEIIQILIDNHDTLFPPGDDEDEDDFHNVGGQDNELLLDLDNISLDDLKNIYTVNEIKYAVQLNQYKEELAACKKELATTKAELAQYKAEAERRQPI